MKLVPSFIAVAAVIAAYGVWAATLFGSYMYGRTRRGTNDYSIPVTARLASSFILAIGAALQNFLLPRNILDFTLFLVAGMLWGFIGDIFLSQTTGLKNSFLYGMLAFAIGHFFYIAAFWQAGSFFHVAPAERGASFGALLAIGCIGWYFLLIYHRKKTFLNWAALPYALLLAGTAGSAISAALVNAALWPCAIGAILFLISDMMIAGQQFAGISFPRIGDAIWLTYGPAQALITAAPLLLFLWK